jgi:hypothetical protein
MSPIVKKAVAALALKEVYERVQESRKPQKPSFLARLFKLTLIGGAAYGLFYGYKTGQLQRLASKATGSSGSSYDSYEGSMTVSRPVETPSNNEPVDAPSV